MKEKKRIVSIMERGRYEESGGSFFSVKKNSLIITTAWAYNEEHLKELLKKDRVSYTSFHKLN